MDKKKSIKEKLRNFRREIGKEMPVKEVILFGSRARGKKGRDVDIDIIIVSPSFEGLDFFQRGAKMYNHWKFRHPIDFLCYTPKEFEKLKKKITIVREAVREGILIE